MMQPMRRAAGPYIWVKKRNIRFEPMFSALPPTTDIAQYGRHVRSVPLPEISEPKK
jgi:hypothetical protein